MRTSQPAKRVIADRGVSLPGAKWFIHLYATYSDICEEKVAQRESKDRSAKQNEAVIQNVLFRACRPEGGAVGIFANNDGPNQVFPAGGNLFRASSAESSESCDGDRLVLWIVVECNAQYPKVGRSVPLHI